MNYSIGAAIRLCWLLSFFFSYAQCQFLSNGDIAAKLDELRAHGVPIDRDGSLADKLTHVRYLADLNNFPTVKRFANLLRRLFKVEGYLKGLNFHIIHQNCALRYPRVVYLQVVCQQTLQTPKAQHLQAVHQ